MAMSCSGGWFTRHAVSGARGRRRPAPLALASAVLLVVLGGCGTGEYNRRMQESLSGGPPGSDAEETGVGLSPQAVDIYNAQRQPSGVKIRLPVFLLQSPRPLSADQAQEPISKIPGLIYGYEVDVQVGDAQVPVSCYFALVASSRPQQEVEQEVQRQLAQVAQRAQWQSLPVAAPDGSGSQTARRISITADQNFGQVSMPGRLDVYLVTVGPHHVLIAWRAPASATWIFQAAEAAMGTVTFQQ